MKQSEAVRVVGVLNGYYPSKQIPNETIALWATEIVGFAYEDALTAVRAIGTNARFMPSLAELVADIRLVQLERERAERPALPSGEEAGFVDLAEWRERYATPEQREALSRFIERLSPRREEA